MQVALRVRPVAHRRNDVALEAGGAYGCGMRQLTRGDAVGPVRKVLERNAAEQTLGEAHHLAAGLSGLDATQPGRLRGVELAEACRERARRQIAQLMTTDATHV